jgi:hypothetical protein
MIREARSLAVIAGVLTAVALPLAAVAQAQGEPDRSVLPIAEPTYPPITELDARKAKAPPRFEVKAPAGAPNVVIVLIDDMGLGQPSTFGGSVAVAAAEPVPPGKATIFLDFTYDGGGLGKGATATLSVNGRKVAEGRIEHTVPLAFSGDEGADVGVDEATNVTDAYKKGDNRFTGKIHRVTVELGDATAQADAAVHQTQKDIAQRSEIRAASPAPDRPGKGRAFDQVRFV